MHDQLLPADDAGLKLIARINASTARTLPPLSVHALAAAQAARTPLAVAVVGEDGRRLTYAELEASAEALAGRLSAAGVGPGSRVGLAVERSPSLLIGLLGILKAGAAYVPLDPGFPQERLHYMVADAAISLLVSEAAVARELALPVATTLLLEDATGAIDDAGVAPSEAVSPDAAAYVIYTSGSTGQPKGVVVPHGAVVNFLASMAERPGLTAGDRVLAVTTLSFDIAVLELLLPLTVGAQVVLATRETASDGARLRALIERTGVTLLQATPATYRLLLTAGWPGGAHVRALIGGEALPRDLAQALAPMTGALWNMYGPTETTVWSTCWPVPADLGPSATILIGQPIANTQVHVLDAAGQPVPQGATGELWIGGAGVTTGYHGRPELTAERFVPDPFRPDVPGARLYRTGDLARWTADGQLECLGRVDHQVKLRGYRIELGEIEHALAQHAAVAQAAVLVREDRPGDARLVAYVVERAGGVADDALRAHLKRTLPDYMLPGSYVRLPALPLTANGKVDRQAFPSPTRERPTLDTPFVAPRTATERALAAAWSEVLEIDGVGVLDSFFDLGGTSLLAVRVAAVAREKHGIEIPVIRLFRHPTIAGLAPGIDGASTATPAGRVALRSAHESVAVIGVAVRVPGADSVDEFWANLVAGVDSISHWSPEEIDPDVPTRLRDDPRYVRARGALREVEMFDAAFFGMTPREAQLMDPQHRLTLELAWEALEDAGYAPGPEAGRVAVFSGVNANAYELRILSRRPELVEQFGEFNASLLNQPDYVATRVSHKLGLTGPAMSVHTACSTGLVTIIQAVESLRAGRCEVALAGAVSITLPHRSGHLYLEEAMLSRDGHTRTFDAGSSGTSFGDGAAMVVLKRLSDAERDGDRVLALIRGVGINNDGAAKSSFTAPSVEGQAAAIAMAHADAGVDARDISYVEAHGTGTPLGDPIEVEALTQVFRSSTPDVGFCAIGSVKSNIGHAVTAAGTIGFVKTVLALHHERIPATLHFERPNPNIDFTASPFVVAATERPWPRGTAPRRAGVSSFGVGGTNAHVVLEEAPVAVPSPAPRATQLLVLSARTEAALATQSARLAAALRADSGPPLADVAHTLQRGRRALPYRLAVPAASHAEAVGALEAPRRAGHRRAAPVSPPVAFMFPGQGSQYLRMGAPLYAREPVFRAAFDRCIAAAAPVLGIDLRDVVFAEGDADAAARALRETSITQPALFAIEFALATLWNFWGVQPTTMIGHSVGEFVAAAIAGVFSVEDAMRLVATRGRLMQSMPPGSMLSVRAAAEVVASRLDAELTLASENAPALCVVAGPTARVAELHRALEADGVACSLLHTSHAFHSPMMEPAVEEFAASVREVPLAPPTMRFVSSVTGTWITDGQATDPMYWARHLRETVRFSAGVRTLLAEETALLEVGPRATLATLARQHLAKPLDRVVLASLADAPEKEERAVLGALGELWCAGVDVEWDALHAGESRRRVSLPTYPFERKRHWVDRPVEDAPATSVPTLSVSTLPPPVVPIPASAPAPLSSVNLPSPKPSVTAMTSTNILSRRARLAASIAGTLEQVSGVEVRAEDADASFAELGLDSLTLTQVALALTRTYGVKITIRNLLEELSTLNLLTERLFSTLPPEPAEAPPGAVPVPVTALTSGLATPLDSTPAVATMAGMSATLGGSAMPTGAVQQLIEQQLQIMASQLALLSGAARVSSPALAAAPTSVVPTSAPVAAAADAPVAEEVLTTGPQREFYDAKKAFGAAPRIIVARASDELTPVQRARLDAFVRRYNARTRGSKRFTQDNRAQMADPRVVSGFRPTTKELVYPIVVERSEGAYVWDVDGNQYIDLTSGFGSNLFGWRPQFVVDALKAQLDRGFEVGPQHPLTAEVATLFREITGVERVAFCNTGSEAVLGAIRIARTVTGRSLIVTFTNSYHGINDEVIVRATRSSVAVPAAPGILPESTRNVLVLDYGSDEALRVIRERGHELAAVLVEPVQSRRPDFQPREFLHELRRITAASGTALVFDEIITGFRTGMGGAQEYFGVTADLGTYGKVIGGGVSFGVIAGKREFMDALDGGHWQFGDDSKPEVGVTYFAGTFVRHPLALAAAKASLLYIKQHGPRMQQELAARAQRIQEELNAFFALVGAPLEIRRFSSLWKTFWTGEHVNGDLLWYMLRDRGIHVYDGFPCYMTVAHSDADVAAIIAAFKDAVTEMQEGGFLPGTPKPATSPRPASTKVTSAPPVPGARLGRDKDGSPAWFVADSSAPGGYRRVEADAVPVGTGA